MGSFNRALYRRVSKMRLNKVVVTTWGETGDQVDATFRDVIGMRQEGEWLVIRQLFGEDDEKIIRLRLEPVVAFTTEPQPCCTSIPRRPL